MEVSFSRRSFTVRTRLLWYLVMSLVRIRLSFANVSVEQPKNCWFLVDTSVCRVVADLEYLIKERFDLRKKPGEAVDLYLDDYLLPSQENIGVIRDNDVIRSEVPLDSSVETFIYLSSYISSSIHLFIFIYFQPR